MAGNKKLHEAIWQNAELREKLEGMWKEGAPTSEITEVLAEAGVAVDAAQIEEALGTLQEKSGQVIGLERVDPEQLKKIAGGQQTISDCTNQFKDGSLWENGTPDFCSFYNLCDGQNMMPCEQTDLCATLTTCAGQYL